MSSNHRNLIAGIGIWIVVGLVVAFAASLFGATSGEIAAALAGIIGGGIGAAGAALAVFLTLDGQRKDEAERVNKAIMTEIAEQSRFAIGHLGACGLIHDGRIRAPKSEIPRLFASPRAIIYPAVADRVSRLARPALVVSFFTRLEEMRCVVDVLAFNPPTDEIVTSPYIQQLADLLISVCQIAKLLLEKPESDTQHEDDLAAAIRATTTRMIDESLAAAKIAFPTAESWGIKLS